MRKNIINLCDDDIRGSISSIYWENVPNLEVGGEGGGRGFPISFILLWGCIRDSGGVDLQTKLYERDRDSGKEIPHKESFPKVESPMNPRIVVYKSA